MVGVIARSPAGQFTKNGPLFRRARFSLMMSMNAAASPTLNPHLPLSKGRAETVRGP